MLLLNNRPIDYFTFPGGELQVRVPELIVDERVTLTWKPKSAEKVILLLLTVNALRNAGIYDIQLDCLYLPYARQDRVCSPGEAISVEVICKLLDDLGLHYVRFWDLHNEEKAFECFQQTAISNTERFEIFQRFRIIDDFDTDNLIVCAPDDGAMEGALKLCEKLELWNPVYFAKKRDPKTGEIISYEFQSFARNMDDRNVLIVDDICDGGRTFIEAAKCLKSETTGKLFLYVTHGIFSKGIDELLEYYQHIYCHHVLDDSRYVTSDRLTVLRSFAHVGS